MSGKLTIDERIDKYADFAFDILTLVKAYSASEDIALKAKAFDKVVKLSMAMVREAAAWNS